MSTFSAVQPNKRIEFAPFGSIAAIRVWPGGLRLVATRGLDAAPLLRPSYVFGERSYSLEASGEIVWAEIHWYEATGIGL
jgi:hypothetical protein